MQKKIMTAIILITVYLLTGCSFFGSQAPLEDGMYLSYDYEGTILRADFSKLNSKQFTVTVRIGLAEDFADGTLPDGRQTVVDMQLKTERGAVYELGSLGPLWIAPESVKVGGNAHGDKVIEVKQWHGWKIGVVKASFGVGGALKGEWYYEKTTGFLVGGGKSSIISEGGGSHFILQETNLAALQQ